jgi:hypothetical protein
VESWTERRGGASRRPGDSGIQRYRICSDGHETNDEARLTIDDVCGSFVIRHSRFVILYLCFYGFSIT